MSDKPYQPLTRVSANHVDLALLNQQINHLADIREYLTSGDVSPYTDYDQWPDAIDGILNLLAALEHSTLRRETK